MKELEKKISKIKVYNEHNLPTTHYSNFKDLQGDLKVLLDENLEKLKKSIIEFGVFVPNFVWKNKDKLYTMDGHQRKKAFISLETEGYIDDTTGEVIKYKIPEIPYLTISAENKKDAGKKLLQLNSKYGSINDETVFFEEFEIDISYIDDIEIPELEDLNISFDDDMNFDDEGLDDMEVDENAESVCEDGDLWKLGDKHRLICGDCLDENIIKRLIGEDNIKFDLTFTDPPYNLNYEYNNYKDNKTESQYKEFCKNWFNVVNELSENIIITSGKQNLKMWYEITEIKDIAIWLAKNKMSGGKISNLSLWEPVVFIGEFDRNSRPNDLFEYNTRQQEDVGNHTCPKIIGLILDIIHNYSKKGDNILDIFMGSGTTLMACEKLGRTSYGVEIDKLYCDVILKRYLDYTGIEPVREDGKTYNELKD